MLGIVVQAAERHLVGAPVALGALAVDLLRAGPALGRAQDDHRPARPPGESLRPRLVLDAADVGHHRVERRGHLLVHRHRVVAFDEVRRVAVAEEQVLELLRRDAGEHGGVGDLVAVEMQDRQHRAVGDGIEELVGVPAGRQRAGLRLAVADDAPRRSGRGCRTRRHRRATAHSPARRPRGSSPASRARRGSGCRRGRRTGVNSRFMPGGVGRHVGIDLAVGAFEPGVGDDARPAMAGTGDVDHVEIVAADQPVEVDVDEVQPRRGAPVAEQARLDVLLGERPAQQRIVVEIDLADGEVVGGAPPRIDQAALFPGQALAIVTSDTRDPRLL